MELLVFEVTVRYIDTVECITPRGLHFYQLTFMDIHATDNM